MTAPGRTQIAVLVLEQRCDLLARDAERRPASAPPICPSARAGLAAAAEGEKRERVRRRLGEQLRRVRAAGEACPPVAAPCSAEPSSSALSAADDESSLPSDGGRAVRRAPCGEARITVRAARRSRRPWQRRRRCSFRQRFVERGVVGQRLRCPSGRTGRSSAWVVARARTSRPSFRDAGCRSRASHLDEGLELVLVVRLRQDDERRVLGRCADDGEVDLRAERGLDVVFVVTPCPPSLLELRDRQVAARELLRERVELLPLARARVPCRP